MLSPSHTPMNNDVRIDENDGTRLGRLFVCFFVTSIVVNFDGGAIAAVLPEFELGCAGNIDYNDRYPCLSEWGQGLLGSMPYIGLFLGCPFAGLLLRKCNAKAVILVGLFAEIAATIIFSFTIQAYPLLLAKLVVGFSYSALRIHLPIWVDQFAPLGQKTMWLGWIQTTGAVGSFVGYATAAYLSSFDLSYQIAFRIQAIGLVLCFIVLTLAPKHHIICVACSGVAPGIARAHLLPSSTFSGFDSIADPILRSPVGSTVGPATPEAHAMRPLHALCCNRVYRSTVLARCSLFFVVTSVQFWSTKYFITAFEQPRELVHAVFICIACSAPTLGVVIGSSVIDRSGGYTGIECQVNAAFVSSLCGVVAACAGGAAALIAPGAENWRFMVVSFSVWVQLLFGAAMLPPTTGLVLQSVGEELMVFANTSAVMLYTILGYGLGTYLPGQIDSVVSASEDPCLGMYRAMQATFLGALPGVVFMLDAYFGARYRLRQNGDAALVDRQS